MNGATRPGDLAIGWYVLAFVVYVGLGLALGTVVLNWIVGPLFLLFALHVLPRTLLRLSPRRPRAPSGCVAHP